MRLLLDRVFLLRFEMNLTAKKAVSKIVHQMIWLPNPKLVHTYPSTSEIL